VSDIGVALFGFNVIQAGVTALTVHMAHRSGRRAVLSIMWVLAAFTALAFFSLLPPEAPPLLRLRATIEIVSPYYFVATAVLWILFNSASSALKMEVWCAVLAVLVIPVTLAFNFDAMCDIGGDCAL